MFTCYILTCYRLKICAQTKKRVHNKKKLNAFYSKLTNWNGIN